jgi:hypothetical protein
MIAWSRLAIARSSSFIAAIAASSSRSPSARFLLARSSAFNSRARAFIAACSSAVNPFDLCVAFSADFPSAIAKHLRASNEPVRSVHGLHADDGTRRSSVAHRPVGPSCGTTVGGDRARVGSRSCRRQSSRTVRSRRRSRSGSLKKSSSTILPFLTVTAAIENGCPWRKETPPATPLINAGRISRASRA